MDTISSARETVCCGFKFRLRESRGILPVAFLNNICATFLNHGVDCVNGISREFGAGLQQDYGFGNKFLTVRED